MSLDLLELSDDDEDVLLSEQELSDEGDGILLFEPVWEFLSDRAYRIGSL